MFILRESILKYLFKISLHIVNDSKLFRTFFPQCISLRDSISSFTFLSLKLYSFDTTFVFSQSTSLKHCTLCLANPPPPRPPLPFFHLPFFRSLFANLTLLSCSFFLSLISFMCLQNIPPSHTCISFTFFPGLNAVRNRCFEANRLNCSEIPRAYGTITIPLYCCSSTSLSPHSFFLTYFFTTFRSHPFATYIACF